MTLSERLTNPPKAQSLPTPIQTWISDFYIPGSISEEDGFVNLKADPSLKSFLSIRANRDPQPATRNPHPVPRNLEPFTLRSKPFIPHSAFPGPDLA